jgi:RNA polymerase sigma factor FliA
VSAGAVLKQIEPEPPRAGATRAEPLRAEALRAEPLRPENVPSEPRREQILLEHLAQVHHIARRIHDRLPPQVPLDDLVHAGILGLMDAVRKYDASKNVLLKHYAEFRIRGAILDSLRQVDWSPRTLRRQAKRVEQARFVCRARLGRDPSESEIAEEIGVTLKRLQRILGDVRGLDVSSLHSETSESNGEDTIGPPADSEEDPYQEALRGEMTSLLDKAIGELAARERDVIALYHFEELTMKQVGAILGIGESRVSQIHSAALLRLRARLRQLTEKAPCVVAPGARRAAVASVRDSA